MTNSQNDSAVAIVGWSGRFPGAASVDELWKMLVAGRRGFETLTDEELNSAGVHPAAVSDPAYVKVCAPVSDFDRFDADFFGFTPRQAVDLDPQHRLFLECAWLALEDAACDPTTFEGRIGVFAGAGVNRYSAAAQIPEASGSWVDDYTRRVAAEKDFLATRVSYKLGLTGPSLSIQTACSTSLVAIHVACQSLLSGESDAALAGGVSLLMPGRVGYLHQEGGIASPDGRCRAFDAGAKGTVPAGGVAIVVLRRLADALRDRQRIYAVIQSTAVNNDGSDKMGFTSPSVAGQSMVLKDALADIDPSTVEYIEAHGTGTSLGDAMELRSLGAVYAGSSLAATRCALGSIKSNIGHLDVAAGAAGLIKASLCLHHATMVPSVDFVSPNAELESSRRLFVNTGCVPWQKRSHPRRAAVSSFGIGGTNAHAVLEEAPESFPSSGPDRLFLVPVSAKTPEALASVRENLARHLEANPTLPIASVERTLQVGRRAFHHREAIIATDLSDLVTKLRSGVSVGAASPDSSNPVRRGVTFVVGEDLAAAQLVRELIGKVEPFDRALEAALGELGSRWRDPLETWFRGGVTRLPFGEEFNRKVSQAGERSWMIAMRELGIEPVMYCSLHDQGARRELGTYHAAGRSTCVVIGDGVDTASLPELAGAELIHVGTAAEAVEQRVAGFLWMLGRIWCTGSAVNWSALHGEDKAGLCTLPGYPFLRQRYWPDVDPEKAVQARPQRWVQTWKPRRKSRQRSVPPSGRYVLVGDGLLANAIAGRLIALDLAPRRLTWNEGSEDAWTDLLFDRNSSAAPDQVIMVCNLAHGSKPGELCGQIAGMGAVITSLLRARAASGSSRQLTLRFVTSLAAGLPADAHADPCGAALAGLATVVAQEHPELSVAISDLSADPTSNVIDTLLTQDAGRGIPTKHAQRGARWLERAVAPCIAQPAERSTAARSNGVYLVTGGCGKLGVAVAESIATDRGGTVVLVSRQAREEVASAARRRGTEVLAVSADVSDETALRKVVDDVERRFGEITGVFHLAADLSHRSAWSRLEELRQPDFVAQLRPKLDGAQVIDAVFSDRQLEFALACSSISTLLGGTGLGAYAAANASIDGMPIRETGNVPWITVGFDAIGNRSNAARDSRLTPEEAVQQMWLSIDESPESSVLVSRRDLQEQILAQQSQPVVLEAPVVQIAAAAGGTAVSEAPPGDAAARTSDLVDEVTAIWKEVLGLKTIGIDDDLFDLDGDSLSAMMILSSVRDAFGVEVPLRSFVASTPTIRHLCRELEREIAVVT